MVVALQKVQESEKMILRNLYSLYLHDLSKFTTNITIGADGFFEYEDLHMFWENDGITPYFIKIDHSIVGFLLLLERPFLEKENDFSINDIFILNQYKGKGIGKKVIENLLEAKRGQYFVIELIKNIPAVSFWKKVYRELKIKFDEQTQLIDDEECLVQTFKI
ncbi:GNAT family N-acetyltransferase [Bacillus nitratireducens]|uniref:GNAT family N-acetyltransferase n=1 Tax=Bacillus nitratireducens TaxID=2026193 RepID=UPI000BEBC8B0|nr:GNAT family N-acetyltransferase [Bacillus nitratireducens]PEE15308.1 GNAT family N-acetyltransferase [Bacillus cereus]MED0901409.1 GNAT family N-acetyltransferase [Bacillus nitratireducens]PFH89963.1 GNAT family N-acetyltransferase [Bacillus cereus]PFM63039.1 GNAT family N-acetyltransferase [Bacillus cereus]PFS12163.1 GNAT family N-acetyltransferase [Bacillus cereus]